MDDAEFRGLQERVQLINDMTAHPGWDVAVDRARASIYMKQKQLIRGDAKSYEEYLKLCEWMSGCQFFMDLPQIVQRELEVELENREEA